MSREGIIADDNEDHTRIVIMTRRTKTIITMTMTTTSTLGQSRIRESYRSKSTKSCRGSEGVNIVWGKYKVENDKHGQRQERQQLKWLRRLYNSEQATAR